MRNTNYTEIIKHAWREFDNRHEIKAVYDVSVHVSTNHVYKISFYNREPVFAKLSDYGKFEDFREDHIIINNLANNLERPYENFLAQSLVKKNELFTYRYHHGNQNAWVVFYNPIKTLHKLPRRLDEKLIRKLGRELAWFHIACTNVSNQLPGASKSLATDINQLMNVVESGALQLSEPHKKLVLKQGEIFLENTEKIKYNSNFETIPVFVDWNIGNFSITSDGKLYSRWDYDWFRMATRVMDFYFFSRVVSDAGDRTVFSYLVNPLMEERFLIFLKEYHRIFPLSEPEVKFIKEAYRFFILNYVIKDGPYFFRQVYSSKLMQEAFNMYFPSLDANFREDVILKALKI
jgi:hypothetical protein